MIIVIETMITVTEKQFSKIVRLVEVAYRTAKFYRFVRGSWPIFGSFFHKYLAGQ